MASAETADYGLLSPAWAGTRAAALTSDEALLQAMLDVELEWLRVLASAGLIDAHVPDAVAPACQAARYDIADLAARAQGGGNPVIPLLADLRAIVREEAPAAVGPIHKAATSQDILDTALMLMSARALETILADAYRAQAGLAALARGHAETLSVARTLTQHSLPSTFGLKAAQWLHGIGQATAALESAAASLPLQWGGASGTMAALTATVEGTQASPLDLAAELAARLGLADPVAPWQTNRLPVTSLGTALADLLAAAGKVSNDVLLLSRPEIGEVSEPRAAGRGGSSAMPQKQNPVLSVLIRSAALSAPGYAAMLQAAAGAADDERPGGSWHVEWQALRQLLRLAGGAAAKLAELTSGLQVHTDAVAGNLSLAGPLIVSEKVMARVAPLLDAGTPGQGKKKVQELVSRSLAGEDFAALLRSAVPAEALSDAEIKELLDPANYVGQSSALIERIISAYPGRNNA
ncbi:adenylosuccinate lyase family protein [Arthrobacter sp. BL-252-APC-1A]|uniref:lyase family protein n=1 Tax=Arthrobacter sp. BL-252-APC-1A TaxID=2606622 RepID=UPI0012B24884|nr:lyase family protein [Arthrobacter sp. BL-252-APC-1A]MSR97982.1 adenylosuccinate lyase family protein [Arthrobacter sp. BL-252-APC-1A]